MTITVTLTRAELSALRGSYDALREFDKLAPDGRFSIEWTPFASAAASVAFPKLIGWLQGHRLVPLGDFHRANLSYAGLSEANLTGADLSYSNLMHANLIYANLTHANLRGAYLNGAYMHCAVLTGADLTHADLRGARLVTADLRGTIRSLRDHAIPGWHVHDGELQTGERP